MFILEILKCHHIVSGCGYVYLCSLQSQSALLNLGPLFVFISGIEETFCSATFFPLLPPALYKTPIRQMLNYDT